LKSSHKFQDLIERLEPQYELGQLRAVEWRKEWTFAQKIRMSKPRAPELDQAYFQAGVTLRNFKTSKAILSEKVWIKTLKVLS